MKRVQNSDLLNTKMPLILLLVWITVCMCTNRYLFHRTALHTVNAGETTIVLWITAQELQQPAIQTKIVQSFGGFFHLIKVRQPIRRKDSIQTVIRTSRGRIHFSMKRLQLFQIFRTEIKIQKPFAVDVLFKAYPMIPLS